MHENNMKRNLFFMSHRFIPTILFIIFLVLDVLHLVFVSHISSNYCNFQQGTVVSLNPDVVLEVLGVESNSHVEYEFDDDGNVLSEHRIFDDPGYVLIVSNNGEYFYSKNTDHYSVGQNIFFKTNALTNPACADIRLSDPLSSLGGLNLIYANILEKNDLACAYIWVISIVLPLFLDIILEYLNLLPYDWGILNG